MTETDRIITADQLIIAIKTTMESLGKNWCDDVEYYMGTYLGIKFAPYTKPSRPRFATLDDSPKTFTEQHIRKSLNHIIRSTSSVDVKDYARYVGKELGLIGGSRQPLYPTPDGCMCDSCSGWQFTVNGCPIHPTHLDSCTLCKKAATNHGIQTTP